MILDILPVRWDKNVGRVAWETGVIERVPGAAETESRFERMGAADIEVGAIDPAREAEGVLGLGVGGAGGRMSHPNNATNAAVSDGADWWNTFPSSKFAAEPVSELEDSGDLTKLNADVRDCTCAGV